MSDTKKTENPDILYYDFQGWPVIRKTFKQLLEQLRAVEIEDKDGNKFIGFPADDKILSIYPRTLVDDGMGYGVDEKWVHEASTDKDKTYMNIFIDAYDKSLKNGGEDKE